MDGDGGHRWISHGPCHKKTQYQHAESSMVGGGCHQTYIIYHMAHACLEYQDKIENVGFYKHPRNRFLSNPHLPLNRAGRAQRHLLYFCIFLIHPPQSPTQPRPVQYNTIYPFLQGSSNFFRVLQIPARFFNVRLSGQDNLTKRTGAIDAIFSTITLWSFFFVALPSKGVDKYREAFPSRRPPWRR